MSTRWLLAVSGALAVHLGGVWVLSAALSEDAQTLKIQVQPTIGLTINTTVANKPKKTALPTPKEPTQPITKKQPPKQQEAIAQKPVQKPAPQKVAKTISESPRVASKPTPKSPPPQPTTVAKLEPKQTPLENEAYEVTAEGLPIISKPNFLYKIAPKYPRRAQQKGHEGQVIIDATVDATGTIQNITVHQSSGFESLDKSALRAVKRWRFKPFSINGKNIQAVIRVPVNFTLEKPRA